MWTAMRQRGLKPIENASANGWPQRPRGSPAWPDAKARLLAGADADFAVFDPDADVDRDARRSAFSPQALALSRRGLRGRVLETWLRGERVFRVQAEIFGGGRAAESWCAR